MAARVLYLRDTETELYHALPESLRHGWTIEIEKIQAYETPVDLKMRRLMVHKELPSLGDFIDQFCDIDHPKEMVKLFRKLGKVSWVSVVNIFYAIGAIGLCPLIESALRDAVNAQDMDIASKLSLYRHLQLQSNDKFLPPSSRA